MWIWHWDIITTPQLCSPFISPNLLCRLLKSSSRGRLKSKNISFQMIRSLSLRWDHIYFDLKTKLNYHNTFTLANCHPQKRVYHHNPWFSFSFKPPSCWTAHNHPFHHYQHSIRQVYVYDAQCFLNIFLCRNVYLIKRHWWQKAFTSIGKNDWLSHNWLLNMTCNQVIPLICKDTKSLRTPIFEFAHFVYFDMMNALERI